MKQKQSFFERRSVVAVFGILAFFAGISFIQGLGKVTGNVVSTGKISWGFVVPTIGILLLICSVILIAYSIVRKD